MSNIEVRSFFTPFHPKKHATYSSAVWCLVESFNCFMFSFSMSTITLLFEPSLTPHGVFLIDVMLENYQISYNPSCSLRPRSTLHQWCPKAPTIPCGFGVWICRSYYTPCITIATNTIFLLDTWPERLSGCAGWVLLPTQTTPPSQTASQAR